MILISHIPPINCGKEEYSPVSVLLYINVIDSVHLKVLLWAAGAAACWLHSQLGHEVLGREAG